MKQRHQVVVVGGGPVGVALAVDLGLRGVSCALVETRTALPRIPKGQNLTQRTLEHFYFWGIADALRAARVMPPGYPIGEVTAYGSLTSPYWHAPAGRELVRPYYWQDNERLPQYRMEEVLRRRMAEIPCIESRFGWSARAVEQDGDGVRVAVAEEAGTTVLSFGGPPVFKPSAWEWTFRASQLKKSDPEAAHKLLEEGLEAWPESPSIYWELGCWEAVQGDKAAALDWLRKALEREPRMAEYLETDDDLRSLRDDPEFKSLMSG